jgi:glycosyltransferase involved in cell wall biosynthesis
VTLAEPGYQKLFRHQQEVFANHPPAGALPEPGSDQGYVVYVGDVTEQRGAMEMVDAVALMPESRPLRVVGRVSDGLAARMHERAGVHGVRLGFDGQLPHRAAMEVVSGASAGLSLLHDTPNYRQSLPTKVIEYLAMGIPVVASDLPGTRSAVEGLDSVWLVPSRNAAAAGQALARAVERRGDAAAQAPAVRERFVWPADEFVAFYASLAG